MASGAFRSQGRGSIIHSLIGCVGMRNSKISLIGCSFWVVVLFAVPFFGGCATRSEMVNHQFKFDAISDSPGIAVLDYQYGTTAQPGARPAPFELRQDHIGQQTSVSGDMVRGDFLYVKWKIKNTGEVLEDRVDLKHLEPENIEGCIVYFVVKDRQLYVYLITPEKNPAGWPQYSPPGYTHLKTYQLYPKQ